MSSSAESLLVKKNWVEVLTQVEQTVCAALAEVGDREKALEDFIQSAQSADGAQPSWPQLLEDFLARKHQLRELGEQASPKVADVDALLAEREEELGQWLEQARAAQQKLSEWKRGSDKAASG